MARQTPKGEYWTEEETARFTLADTIKEFIEDTNPLLNTASMYTDLLNAALSEVDWNEIAENILADS
ncbi:MAG: hypothetical protein CMI54_02765 [Parcubacteria group bacterium]|nr:hypothetical protein [Parcubacteria group bacterium]